MQLLLGEGIRLGGPAKRGKSKLHECMQTYICSLTFLAFPYICSELLQILKFLKQERTPLWQNKKATRF